MTSLNHSNNLCLVALPSPSPSAELDKLQSKLAALKEVKELCEYYKNSNNPQNDPNNLLDNLCDGLQTFLGYDKNSKGYNGTGIVYSDLDRLCDGVMGFLSGVLDAVKDDDAVKTYDNYIEGENNRLAKLLNDLKSSIGKGSAEFGRRVTEVSEWLEKYWTQVNGKTLSVLSDLQTVINNISGKHIGEIHDTQGLEAQMTHWKKTLDKIAKRINDTETKHVYLLDETLKADILSAINCIHRSVAMLCDSAKEKRFLEHVAWLEAELLKHEKDMRMTIKNESRKVGETLKTALSDIGNSIATEFPILDWKLKSEVEKILNTINTMRQMKNRGFHSIRDALQNAQQNIEGQYGNFDKEYTQRIAWKFDEIKNYVDKLVEEKSVLNTEFKKVKESVDQLEENVKIDLGNLRVKIYEKFDNYLKSGLNEFKSLEAHVKTDLGKLRNNIDTAMKTYVRKYFKEVRKEVGVIKGNKDDASGLEGIIAKVEEYANAFVNRGFDTIVDGWIENILNDNGIIKRWIEKYYKHNKDHFDSKAKIENSQSMYPKIKKAIKEALTLDIKQAGAQVALSRNRAAGHINANIKAVQAGCRKFVEELGKTITEAEVRSFAEGIAEVIGSQVKSQDPGSRYNNHALNGIVEATLITLSSIAKQSCEELNELITGCDFADINSAVNAAAILCGNLDTALKESSTTATAFNPGTATKEPIHLYTNVDKTIAGILDENIGANVWGTFTSKFSDKMSTFHATNEKLKTVLNRGINGRVYEILTEEIGYNGGLGSTGIDLSKKMDKFYKAEQAIQAAMIPLQQQIELLKHVPETVGKQNEQSGKLLDEIKDRLYRLEINVRSIIREVDNADKSLSASIDAVQNALQVAELTAKRSVAYLKEHLTKQVGEAHNKSNDAMYKLEKHITNHVDATFMCLTNDFRTWLAKRNIADLEALKTLIHTQRIAVEKIIDINLINGVKGFLKTLSGICMETNSSGPPSSNEYEHTLNSLKTFTNSEEQKKFAELSNEFHSYITNIHTYINNQVTDPTTPSPTDPTTDPASKLTKIKTNFDNLLEHLQKDGKKYNYDNKFVSLLSTLSTSLSALHPSHFANPRHPELLDAVKKGLEGFVTEMGKAYVNGYDGGEGIKRWVENDGKKDVLTAEGKNGAKAFLSIIELLYGDLREFYDNCKSQGDWRRKRIHVSADTVQAAKVNPTGETNPFGEFMQRCGFEVSKYKDSQDGQLNNSVKSMGMYAIKGVHHFFNEHHTGQLDTLVIHLQQYYKVCHYSTFTSRKHPCSVYEMLCWFSGLRHNPIYAKLKLRAQTMFADKDHSDFVYKIYDFMEFDFPYLCTYSYNLLTAITGTGDQFTVYASDFANNSLGLTYPTSGEACFDMMLDILRRLFSVFRFLHTQCKNASSDFGWEECQYGKHIPTTKSQCNGQPECQSNGQPRCQPKCQATCESKCQPKCETSCQPTSPLMCYLNDCLPGHLPHQLIEVGCKAECKTCPTSTPGMPCLTPLGFRAFSGSTKTGKELCKVIQKLINIRNIAILFAISPKPPSTLPEHFGFALSLVSGWNNSGTHTLKTAIESSMKKISMELCDAPNDLTTALIQAYGSTTPNHGECNDSHLRNLTTSDSCKQKQASDIECAPYLLSVCYDQYCYLSTKHANAYLSWAIYLPWNFWNYLKNLYDAFCSIVCQDWGCRSCMHKDKCKTGKHGVIDMDTPTATCQCTSIVTCKGVRPTLYKCGFNLQNPSSLNHKIYPNKCSDFCTQLNKLLQSKYFAELFDKCDDVLFKIRAPFIWLNVALWLLSFLYLLHSMVIRLDLLHIKSHLHSPSSHRIAAQSLLAAARVNKLNRVFYLQP